MSLVTGRVLGCGCLTGTYRTASGEVVMILDARGGACPHLHHRKNAVLWRRFGASAASFGAGSPAATLDDA
jgi:hypothetical protein